MAPSLAFKMFDWAEVCARFELRWEAGRVQLFWLHPTSPRTKVGTRAGSENRSKKTSYRWLNLTHKTGRKYRIGEHWVVFAMTHKRWPNAEIDHRDGDGLNNNPTNLREATTAQNCRNQKVRKTNKLGVKGCSYRPGRANPYIGQVVGAGYKSFRTLVEAQTWCIARREALHGDFARTES